MKRRGITGIYISALTYPSEGPVMTRIAELADILIGLDVRREGNRLVRTITLWKNRAAPTPDRVGLLEIGDRGEVRVRW
jgi:KaiC/GvpD/RAD55 family RecA-like ATPase